ncbi:unnamed protein product [Coregonus sp. 'balchen']|nr:unnamed protein product [Coregonus sp. 'balchen']
MRFRENAMKTLRHIAADNGKTMPHGELIANKQVRLRIVVGSEISQLLIIAEALFSCGLYGKSILLSLFWFANAFYYGLVLLTSELLQAGDVCGFITQGAKIEPKCDLECKYLTLDDNKKLLGTTLAEFPTTFNAFIYNWQEEKHGDVHSAPVLLCWEFIFIARAFITGGFQVYSTATRDILPPHRGLLSTANLQLFWPIQALLKKSVYLTLSVYCICCLLATGASVLLPIETTGWACRRLVKSQPARR